MPTILLKIFLFLSSYAPLSFVFFFLFWKEDQRGVAWALAGIGLLSVMVLWIFLKVIRRTEPVEISVATVERKDTEALSYIASYVIPFVAVPGADVYQALALGVFFLVLAIIYINSNLIYINPTLTLLRYHLYEIADDKGNSYSLVSKNAVKRNSAIKAVVIGDEIAIGNHT